jgi:phosphoadenosine phosphosulfate reductase
MPSLQDKLEASRRLLAGLIKRHDPSRVAVAWTGGKDSTVALDLWRSIAPHPVQAINLDTGYKFPEILAFRDNMAREWGIALHIARPVPARVPPAVAADKLACCQALKIEPLREAIALLRIEVLLTGVRADENPTRTGVPPLEEKPGYLQANPILDWTEMDVWARLTSRNLPYCTLYDQGYRSIGCKPCTVKSLPGQGERGGRDEEKEARMAELRSLGYF